MRDAILFRIYNEIKLDMNAETVQSLYKLADKLSKIYKLRCASICPADHSSYTVQGIDCYYRYTILVSPV